MPPDWCDTLPCFTPLRRASLIMHPALRTLLGTGGQRSAGTGSCSWEVRRERGWSVSGRAWRAVRWVALPMLFSQMQSSFLHGLVRSPSFNSIWFKWSLPPLCYSDRDVFIMVVAVIFKLWWNTHTIKMTIMTIFKCNPTTFEEGTTERN